MTSSITSAEKVESIHHQSSQTPTVAELSVTLHELSEWELVAVQLRGMTNEEIQKIKKVSQQNVDEQKRLCFSKWLSMCHDASWDDVVTALEKGKELTLAEKVKMKKVSKKASTEPIKIVAFQKKEEEEKTIKELHELRRLFTDLFQDVQEEIENMVEENRVSLQKLARNIQATQIKPLKTLTKCQNVGELIEIFQTKCSFLDGSVLNLIVEYGLSTKYVPEKVYEDLISRTEEHMKRAKKLRRSAPMKYLLDQIHEKTKENSGTFTLTVTLNGVWNTTNIDDVENLIKCVGGNDISAKILEVQSGSVKVTLLISGDEMEYSTIFPKHKKFMCLIGMFNLQVGKNILFKENKNMRNYTFQNGLLEAAKTGHVQAIEFIKSIGIDIDYQNNEGKTALLLASEHGHSEAVKSILSGGASVDIQDNIGLTAVMVAKTVDIYQTLVQANANTDIVTHRGSTPLMISCLHGNHEVANYLLFTLKHKITTRSDGLTLLMAASQGGNERIVEYLLDNRHDPNIQDNDGVTAIQLSSLNGHYTVTQFLLNRNADPNIPDNGGWTPLMIASEEGHQEIVELLLQRGVDPNTTDNKNGQSALMLATLNGHNEIVELLISNGAEYTQ